MQEKVAVYEVDDLSLGRDYALNSDTARLARNDSPPFFYADSVQRLKESGGSAALYIAEFGAGRTQAVAVSTAQAFHLRWADVAPLEFDGPVGRGRIARAASPSDRATRCDITWL